jgi:hypothetical protein
MTFIVNLSTTHDYSINETVGAFAQICNQHSNACLKNMPGFFQTLTNYAWVTAQLHTNYASLIEPYKLGKINTEQFLDNLSQILYFLNDTDKSERNLLLAKAWSSSIKLSLNTQDRLSILVEKSTHEPVYLISNTNELDVRAILNLFQKNHPDLEWNKEADISITNSNEPINIIPNVYLCLSYRYGAFKDQTATTVSLLEYISKKCPGSKTLVSQYPGDLKKGKLLDLDHVFNAEEFYNSGMSNSMSKKQQ